MAVPNGHVTVTFEFPPLIVGAVATIVVEVDEITPAAFQWRSAINSNSQATSRNLSLSKNFPGLVAETQSERWTRQYRLTARD